MERMLERKPLHPGEKQAPPTTVCVTGGASYIGCTVVARLLAAGHTVRATYRPSASATPIVEAMNALTGASKRLRWYEADLLSEGSFDEAIKGCKYVIHTACPVIMGVPKKEVYDRLVGPAVRGVQNVLRSVNKAGTVERVVMTSSVAAVFGDAEPGYCFTDNDYNLACTRTYNGYGMAKTLAEWEAWAIAGQQSKWKLIVLCPGIVFGPPPVPNYKGESVMEVKRLIDGSGWPFVLPTGHAVVDLDDVAAAHVLAMAVPSAHGRYLLAERGVELMDVAMRLKAMYPAQWVPTTYLPSWVVMAALKLKGDEGAIHWVNSEYYKHPMDCSKAKRDLGLRFTPMEKSLKGLVEQMMDDGAVERLPTPAKKVD